MLRHSCGLRDPVWVPERGVGRRAAPEGRCWAGCGEAPGAGAGGHPRELLASATRACASAGAAVTAAGLAGSRAVCSGFTGLVPPLWGPLSRRARGGTALTARRVPGQPHSVNSEAAGAGSRVGRGLPGLVCHRAGSLGVLVVREEQVGT